MSNIYDLTEIQERYLKNELEIKLKNFEYTFWSIDTANVILYLILIVNKR